MSIQQEIEEATAETLKAFEDSVYGKELLLTQTALLLHYISTNHLDMALAYINNNPCQSDSDKQLVGVTILDKVHKILISKLGNTAEDSLYFSLINSLTFRPFISGKSVIAWLTEGQTK